MKMLSEKLGMMGLDAAVLRLLELMINQRGRALRGRTFAVGKGRAPGAGWRPRGPSTAALAMRLQEPSLRMTNFSGWAGPLRCCSLLAVRCKPCGGLVDVGAGASNSVELSLMCTARLVEPGRWKVATPPWVEGLAGRMRPGSANSLQPCCVCFQHPRFTSEMRLRRRTTW